VLEIGSFSQAERDPFRPAPCRSPFHPQASPASAHRDGTAPTHCAEVGADHPLPVGRLLYNARSRGYQDPGAIRGGEPPSDQPSSGSCCENGENIRHEEANVPLLHL
jgi:hypothetical protein